MFWDFCSRLRVERDRDTGGSGDMPNLGVDGTESGRDIADARCIKIGLENNPSVISKYKINYRYFLQLDIFQSKRIGILVNLQEYKSYYLKGRL